MVNVRTTKEVVVIVFFGMVTAVMVLFAVINLPGNKIPESSPQDTAILSQQSQQMLIEEKIATYKSILVNNPTSIRALTELGDVYFDSGRYQEAIDIFLRASEVGPATVHVENDLGLLYLNINQYDLAIERFQRALDVDPSHVDSLFYIGMIYQYKGDAEMAEKVFEKILAANPSPQLIEKVNEQLSGMKSQR